MRKLKFTSRTNTEDPAGASTRAEQDAVLRSMWVHLDSAGLTVEARTLQPIIEGNAAFVVSLARQYATQQVSQETLVRAAHDSLIALLNQYAGRPNELNKVVPIALRSSMATVIQQQPER